MITLLAAVSGTYAWISFQNKATSGILGLDEGPGGSTHDDFDDPNKDIYVENWGNVPIFVRVKLSEYLEVGELAGTSSEEKKVTKLYEDSELGDQTTWHVFTLQSSEGNLFRKYWGLSLGGQKFYKPVPEPYQKDGYTAQDATVYEGTEPGIKQTRNAQVISMAEWDILGRPAGDYWVGDTDGWFYWATPLAPEEATGLLLDKVEKVGKVSGGTYYYGITAVTQLATAEDGSPDDYRSFGLEENGGWTVEGRRLVNLVVNGDAYYGEEPTEDVGSGESGEEPAPSPTPNPKMKIARPLNLNPSPTPLPPSYLVPGILAWEVTENEGEAPEVYHQNLMFDNGKTIHRRFVSSSAVEVDARPADPYVDEKVYGIVKAGDSQGNPELPGVVWKNVIDVQSLIPGDISYFKFYHRLSGNYALVHLIVSADPE
jgi:hypothetical protein